MEAADWASLSDQELLERRISTLGLQLQGTALEPLIRQLYDELSAKGLVFHPPCHVGDEWFVPIGIPAIFIPFFLVHDRLRALERTMMLEVEGETPEWFMKLMRHEAGHAYMYAYQLTRRKKWKECFGQTSREETPNTYRPRPFSRSYVMHLEDWYPLMSSCAHWQAGRRCILQSIASRITIVSTLSSRLITRASASSTKILIQIFTMRICVSFSLRRLA